MESFGWCFIGYGGIANTVAKQIAKKNHKIVSVYGRNFEKASAFAKKYGATAYKTLEEALAAENVEGVYITTTNDSHAAYTRKCIEHGKPVLCEKPFAMNREEAQQVLSLAEASEVYVAEAMWTWHNSVSLQVKNWIRAGTIGEIAGVEARYAFPMLRKNDITSRLVNPSAGGGSLMDIGIYPIRYVYELFGKPEELICRGTLFNGVDVEETAEMKYPGFSAKLFVSFQTFKGEKMVIRGTKGTITIPFFHQATKAVLHTDQKQTARGGKSGFSAYLAQFDHTAAEIRAGKTQSKFVPHSATLDTMELLDVCRKQLNVVYPGERAEGTGEEPLRAKTDAGIKTISHIGFNCKDLRACQDFYCNILGCEVQFVLTYKELAASVKQQAAEAGKPVPGYAKFFEKQGDRVWNVYLKWADGCFIELFDQIGAFRRRVPGHHDLNYTHYSLETDDIRGFRQMVTDRGGAQYLDGEITLGVDQTWQMWLHDPEGNRFEIMEYTDRSYQRRGNPDAGEGSKE